MIFRDSTAAAQTVRGQNSAEDFSTSLLPKTITVSGSSSGTNTVQDTTFNTFTAATTHTLSDVLSTVPLGGRASGPATYASLDTSKFTIDANGVTTYVGAGSGDVLVSVQGLLPKRFALTTSSQGGQASSTFLSFVPGSLGKHLVDSVAALLSGLTLPNLVGTPPFAWSAVINVKNSAGTARNTSVWTGSADLTCLPWDGAGALVSPRDLLTAAHLGTPAIGSTYNFVDNSNVFHTATIAAQRIIASPSGDGADIRVITFAADLPSSITPIKVMPANFRSYIPQTAYPCWMANQDNTILTGDLVGDNPKIIIGKSLDATRSQLWYSVRNGDSGHPAGMIVNGQLVLLTQWHYVGQGPIDSDNITQINAAMSANGSSHTLSTADLSGFNSY
jgi:hypothetical protein